MAFNLIKPDKGLLLDKNKMRLLTEKILNNLYKSSLEEDFLSLLTQEEEDYYQLYPEKEDIYIEIAKSKIHNDLEYLFTFEMSKEERLFLSSLIIQLSLRSPQFIVFYNTLNSLYDDIDALINSTETIKESWYDYSSETGSGIF